MGKRKYRLLNPSQVADQAWSELTNTERLSKMKENYTKKMDELPTNKDAESRFKTGVAGWTEVMRTREIRETVMKAVGRAKSMYLAKRFGVTPTPTV
jgi:hypothetical protein